MQGIKPDTDYHIEQFPLLDDRQTFFYLRRTEEAVLDAVGRIGRRDENLARLLDVGCGLGTQAAKLWLRGWETHGMDASDEMLRLGRFRFRKVHKGVRSVRGIAECLPYRDETFDVVMCQGAMDHFADADLFFGEAARVLKPGGRLVVAVANYESFSCTIGERFHRFVSRFGVRTPAKYKFWRIPEDHTFKGSYRFIKGLAKGRLELVRLHGASMFLFLPPWWKLLEALSFRSAKAVFRAIDRIAYRLPVAADVVIGVWQKPAEAEPVSWRVALAEWRRQSSAVPSYLGRR